MRQSLGGRDDSHVVVASMCARAPFARRKIVHELVDLIDFPNKLPRLFVLCSSFVAAEPRCPFPVLLLSARDCAHRLTKLSGSNQVLRSQLR